MKTAIYLIIFIICYSLSFSQKEASIWYFGNKAGLDFRNGPPVAITDGALNTVEGCATICDTSGNLLFYTNGIRVWNKKHSVIPNGTGLHGHISATQSALIVPKPGNSDIYYIFTVDYIGSTLEYGIQYSVVDITLDNKLGDVTTKNIPLYTPSCEKIIAIRHQNNKDVWVITHDWNSRRFRTFLVNTTGVSASPFISTVGLYSDGTDGMNAIGYLKASHDGKRIVSLMYSTTTIQLFSFNNNTGGISNPILLQNDEYNKLYGAEFSPDNKLLYIGKFSLPNCLLQFNLDAGDADEINNSRVVIDNSLPNYGIGALQIGPNHKIYTSIYESPYIGVINDPNVMGLGCNFVKEAVFLDGGICQSGLPTFIQSYFYPTFKGYTNSPVCEGETILLTCDSIENVRYRWQGPNDFESDEQSPAIYNTTPDMSGKYIISISDSNDRISSDTVIVTIFPNPVIDLGDNIFVCEGEQAILEAPDTFEEYLWHNGSTENSITVTKTDTCWLRVTDINGCVAYDTVIVTIHPIPVVDLGENQEHCEGEIVELGAGGDFSDYLWSDGSIVEKLIVDKTGEYHIKVTSYDGCVGYDTVQVTFNPKLADEINVWLENSKEFVPKDDIKIKLMASFEGLVNPGELMSFKSTISYYRSSLTNISVSQGNTLSIERNGELNLLTFSINAIPVTNDTILLAEIKGSILLSDSSSNKLIVEEFSWEDFNEECDYITRGSSEFRVDACGFDLLHIKSFLPTKMSFNPNPALNKIKFEIFSEEQGGFTLTIYSTEGTAHYNTIWQNHSKNKLKEINMDLSNFPSGIYQVVLKSPWNIISDRLSIIK